MLRRLVALTVLAASLAACAGATTSPSPVLPTLDSSSPAVESPSGLESPDASPEASDAMSPEASDLMSPEASPSPS